MDPADVITRENIGKQKELSEKIIKKDLLTLTQPMDTVNKARMTCLTGPLSSGWLIAVPHSSNAMTSKEFTSLIKLRLGIPLYDSVLACDQCGAALDNYGIHAITCRTTRHNIFRDSLLDLCTEAAWAPVAEKSGLLPNGSFRPVDVFIPSFQNGKGTAIDVTITHPLQPLYLPNSVEKWGVAAEAAEAAKNVMYKDECDRSGVVFNPFAVESMGGLGQGAIQFTNNLCHRLSGRRGELRSVTMGYIRQKLSVALHRSVARSILKRDVDTEVECANFVGRGNLNEDWRISVPAAVPAATIVQPNVSITARNESAAHQSSSNTNVGDSPVIRDKGKEKEDGSDSMGTNSSAAVTATPAKPDNAPTVNAEPRDTPVVVQTILNVGT